VKNEIAEAFDRLLSEQCPPATVSKIEEGQPAEPLWSNLEETGFLDAMVNEQHGGSGLGLADVSELVRLTGRHVLPLPLGETVIARGLMSSKGLRPSSGPIAIAGRLHRASTFLHCDMAIAGVHAQWVLADFDGESRLLRAGEMGSSPLGSLAPAMRWSERQWREAPSLGTQLDLTAIHALVRALQLSGAMAAVLDRSLTYANERQQFGRPIGKFQAIQHDLAVMAEHVYAARMSSEIAARQDGLRFDRLKIAVAKARSSEAAVEVAALAHSVHGAIGFSKEYPLQLWTRRLHVWRQAAGSEAFWHDVLGARLLEEKVGPSLDLLRTLTDQVA
jgi:acyl-CoA dehydrogenase